MSRSLLLSFALVAIVACAICTTARPGGAQTATGGARDLTEAQQRELERIGTLGYTAGGDAAPAESGTTILEPGASEGYTVYVAGDFPGAFLVDLEGRILHTWREDGSKNWTRAWAYPDGSILGVSAYPGRVIKLDSESRILWTYGDKELRAHHDVRVGPDGTIYALMRRGRVLEWLRPTGLLEDLICILKPDGELVSEVECISIPEAFRHSEYEDMLQPPRFAELGDPLHTNSVEVLDGRVPHPAFRAGNILVSIRNMDCLAVIDPERKMVVWANGERWQRQHEATVSPNGHIMLFDNRKFDGRSRVVEYDVVADKIVWSYADDGFFSVGSGAQQLMPNGNVLITESQKGRIFEITRDGHVVWEYWNPRTLDDGRTIVRVTRAFRVPPDFFEGELGERLRQARAVH